MSIWQGQGEKEMSQAGKKQVPLAGGTSLSMLIASPGLRANCLFLGHLLGFPVAQR